MLLELGAPVCPCRPPSPLINNSQPECAWLHVKREAGFLWQVELIKLLGVITHTTLRRRNPHRDSNWNIMCLSVQAPHVEQLLVASNTATRERVHVLFSSTWTPLFQNDVKVDKQYIINRLPLLPRLDQSGLYACPAKDLRDIIALKCSVSHSLSIRSTANEFFGGSQSMSCCGCLSRVSAPTRTQWTAQLSVTQRILLR